MAIDVAAAAPPTSRCSPATNIISSTILTTHDITRNIRDELLSPSPRSIPAFMLYPILPSVPRNIISIYVTARLHVSSGTPIKRRISGPIKNPRTVSGIAHIYTNADAVFTVFLRFS